MLEVMSEQGVEVQAWGARRDARGLLVLTTRPLPFSVDPPQAAQEGVV